MNAQIKFFSICLFFIYSCSLFAYKDGIRIAWDYNKSQFVTGGVYARIKQLHTGESALLYSSGPDVWIRKKNPTDNKWGNAVRVSTDARSVYNYTNSELIELNDHTLIYGWNARPKKEGEGNPYKIMIKRSTDGGLTWTGEQDIYVAGDVGHKGCWEPSFLQLPSGELQIYFANEHIVPDYDQDISMFRSFDNGITWESQRVVTSYRIGARDGMPVPVYLQGGAGIVYAIEDSNINGNFKPVIIRTTPEDNWLSGTVYGNNKEQRHHALSTDYQLGGTIYAGAPYLIQLNTGETVLSIQSSENRTSGDQAVMQVYIGDREAKNFERPSTPFPFLAEDANALWNALCQINDSTIAAVSSFGRQAPNDGIWTTEGKIIQPLVSSFENTVPEKPSSVFIGSHSQACATVSSSWNKEQLVFVVDVKDNDLQRNPEGAPDECDGMEIYLDPQNRNSNMLGKEGVYKLLVNINSSVIFKQARKNSWDEWDASGVSYDVRTNEAGYRIKLSIPWNAIGGRTVDDFGVHFALYNKDGADNSTIKEDLSGGNPNSPRTWLKCSLSGNDISSIDQVQTNDHRLSITSASDILHSGEPFQINIPDEVKDITDGIISIYTISGTMLYRSNVRSYAHPVPGINHKGTVLLSLRTSEQQISTKLLLH